MARRRRAGVSLRRLRNSGRASEELLAESVAFTVIRGLGLDADSSSIPYLAAWAESSDIAVIEQTAGLIDRLASRIETAITTTEMTFAELASERDARQAAWDEPLPLQLATAVHETEITGYGASCHWA